MDPVKCIVQWSIVCILEERRVNLKVGNFLSTKLVDIILGVSILYCIATYEINLINILNDSAKELITNLQHLLKFLMGSPVGLKLNHAFNNTLGNFFLYHIALWRTFLLVTSPLMDAAYTLVSLLATMGFSFQAALAADILTMASFHVYCIYVYAARLYGVQVHGLVSLWRLFIGRKHNPLRDRVDSCQYSHHQLFIGTLAFTILLFLLPTTMLYYAVFTTLRLIMTFTDRMLLWIRQVILSLPLYVTCLWALNSPRTKGTVHVQITDQKKNTGALSLQVTLISDSWWKCVINSRASCQHHHMTHQPVSCRTLVHSIVTGNLF
ncbi:Phosphatidylinositol glycan anchor biosynthesis class Q [Carabus blaptoides fortunei]